MNELLEKAATLCVTMHQGQTDKAGKAYFLHPMRVAMACATDEERIVAMLHDIIEDTEITPDFLLDEGFPEYIVEAVLSVTRQEDESYEDFIKRCALNPIGRQVKIRDLEDNMNICRLNQVTEQTAKRLTRYIKAYHYLSDSEIEDTEDEESYEEEESYDETGNYASDEEMKREAIWRMERVIAYEPVIESFKESGLPQVYEPPYGASYALEEEELEEVRHLESLNNIKAWGVIRHFTTFNNENVTIDSLLYVSRNKEYWEKERELLFNGTPHVVTYCLQNNIKDSGCVRIVPSNGGTVLRD